MKSFTTVLTELQRNQIMLCIDTQLRTGPGTAGGIQAAADYLSLAQHLMGAPEVDENVVKKSKTA